MNRRRLCAGGLVAVALVVSACSSSGKSGSSASKSAASSSASSGGGSPSSGPVKVGRFTFPGGKPSGDPYTVYMLGTFANANTGTAELPPAVKAVTKVVNDRLGGIGGHPLKVEFCDENADPGTATACVNKAIAAKPLAIGGFPILWDLDNRNAVTKAGILDISTNSAASNYSDATTLYPAYGGSSALFSVVPYAVQNNLKSVSIITLDVAAAVGGANALKGLLKQAGIKVTAGPITHAANAADMATPITKAMQGNPQMIIQINGPRECGRGVAAAAQQGYKGQIFITPNCDRKDVFDQAGSGGRKLIVTNAEGVLGSPDNPELSFLSTSLKDNGSSLTASTLQEAGVILTFVNIANNTAKASGGKLTSAALIDAYKNATNNPAYAGYVLDKANKPPIPAFAHIYNSFYRYFRLDDAGKLKDTGKWYSAFAKAKAGLGADAAG